MSGPCKAADPVMPSQDIYKDPDQNTEGLLAALVQQEVAEQEDAGEQLIGNDIWGMACQESREEAQLEGPASAASTSTTTTSSSSETNISDVTSTVLELLKDPSELAPALSSTSFEALPTHLKVLSVLGGGSSKEITPEALQWAARHPELMGHITASLTEAILSQIPPGPQDDNIDSDHLLNLGYTLSNALIALSSAAFNAFSCPAPLASARPAYTHKTGCAPSKWRYLQKILELQGLQRQLICMLREKDAELADIQEDTPGAYDRYLRQLAVNNDLRQELVGLRTQLSNKDNPEAWEANERHARQVAISDDLQRQLTSAHKNLAMTEQSLATARTKLSRMEAYKAERAAAEEELAATKAKLAAERAAMEEELDRQKAAAAAATAKLTQFEATQRQEVEAALDRMEAAAEAKLEAARTTLEELGPLKATLASVQADLEAEKAAHAAAQTKLIEMDHLKATLASLQEELAAEQAAHAHTRHHLEEKAAELAATKAQLVNARRLYLQSQKDAIAVVVARIGG